MVEMQLAQADVPPGPARARTGPASWTRRAAPGRMIPMPTEAPLPGEGSGGDPECGTAASLSRRIW